MGNSWLGFGVNGEENSRVGGEGEVFIGLEVRKLVGKDVS